MSGTGPVNMNNVSRYNESIDWDSLVEEMQAGNCTPLLSNSLSLEHLVPEAELVHRWAEAVEFIRLNGQLSLARVAQFLAVTSGTSGDLEAKKKFLRFLKQTLLERALGEERGQSRFLQTYQREAPRLTVSQAARRLGYADFSDRPATPLAQLARMPIKVYLTTSYHTLLEDALVDAGKRPLSAVYRLNQLGLDEEALDYEPETARPLVYHLHGIDSDPVSLVLSEENYFDLFATFSRDLFDPRIVPRAVLSALTRSSLFLLGFDLYSLEFRVILRGPLKSIETSTRPLSLAIQFAESEPNPDQVHAYLRRYFENYDFSIYWGKAGMFTAELAAHLG